MRVRTKVWIVIAAVCIGLTVYEIPKALFIWRHMRMLVHSEDIFKDDTDAKSALKEEIMASDPEAFDILRYCITDPNDEELAVLAARYPQNEFFLAQLVEKTLIDANLVDSRAVLALTDRLIELSPENAHYRYLKGWAILNRPGESGREKDALEQFELGNELTDFTLPYYKYKERTDRFLDKAGVNPLKRQISLPNETGFYSDMGVFMSRSRGTYPKLDEGSFRSISAELSKAARRLINYQTYGNLNSSFMLLQSVERVRLRELDLSEAEAQQVRFRLSQAMEINEVLGQYYLEMLKVRVDLLNSAAVLSVFTLFIPLLPLPLVWLFVIIVNWIRGRAQQVSVGIKAYLVFIIGLCSMFGLFFPISALNEWLTGRLLGGLVFIGAAVILWILLLLLARIRPVVHSHVRRVKRWSAVICGLLWAIGSIILVLVNFVWTKGLTDVTDWLVFLGGVLFAWFVSCVVIWAIAAYWKNILGVIPYNWLLRNRFVQLMLVLLLMTGITILLRKMPLAPLVSIFLTFLFVVLISTHISKGRFICLDGIRHFFDRDEDIVNTRTKMVRIMSPIMVLYLVTVLFTIHISADKCSDLDELLNNPPSLYRTLPEATQETYEKVLSKKYTADSNAPVHTTIKEDDGIPEELFLASPEDLSALISEREAANNPIREQLLIEVLRKGGHDVRPVILNSLKDPNSLDLLIMRAKWKDRSAKKQLEQIYEEKTTRLAEIVSTIRKDPNSIDSLIIRASWKDKTSYMKMNTILNGKIAELSKLVHDARNESELRSELTTVLEIYSSLPGYGTREQRYQLKVPISRYYRSSFNEIEKSRLNAASIRRLITDANMPELLEGAPRIKTDIEHLTKLFEIAGALAFVSAPQEAEARFSNIINLVGGKQHDESSPELQRSASFLLRAWAGPARTLNQTCLFYRRLGGVPKPNVTDLFKDFVKQRQMIHPYDDYEFLQALSRAGDRDLAEWVFHIVAESPPIRVSYVYLDDIPIGRPVHISEVKKQKRKKQTNNNSYRYLEPIYPYLSEESIPLLLEHLDSDNEQLRAFVVWRLTSLGYEWTSEQLENLLNDDFWKVRLNVLFACNADELEAALDDESGIVRLLAEILSQIQQNKNISR
ncbi:MAG: hypothetical protein E3J56_16530 [Candidatus Aminicenantes bacterium]|nr:MAG: hypothetical protein E3J56_16530 [Candidatus Aminicenantes bacterium]